MLPETEFVDFESFGKVADPGWRSSYLSCEYELNSDVIGARGSITALVEGKDGELLEASLSIEKVVEEPTVEVPETLEFRPPVSLGRPGRRNNLVLFINTDVVSLGHYIRVQIIKKAGSISLLDGTHEKVESVDFKLGVQHMLPDQPVARVLIPWQGTAWNQYANVEASVKVGGGSALIARGKARLSEPEENDGGFFKNVEYMELDDKVPSLYAAGTITVNSLDQLNREVFGADKKEFDVKVASEPMAQQRLAGLLLDEVAFRALEQLRIDNELHLPQNKEVTSIHRKLDTYKFDLARSVFRALVK